MSGIDKITVLQAPGKILTKTWLPGGEIVGASSFAKRFKASTVKVIDIHAMREFLADIEPARDLCLVRGRYIGDEPAAKLAAAEGEDVPSGQMLRRKGYLEDQALHWLTLDVDGYKPAGVDPSTDPGDAVKEFIEESLPPEFHGVSHVWQLSSSAGHPDKAGVLKAHITFWLRNPYTSAEISAWADGLPNRGFDKSAYSPIQILYTAAPIIRPGAPSGPAVRSGFFQSDQAVDEVNLVISSTALACARERTSGPHEPMTDPSGRPGVVGAFCRAFKPVDLPTLMPGVFAPSSRRDGHFDWTDHSSGGVFITSCEHGLISTHDTAPTDTNCRTNIFDFVRLHKFAALDAHCADVVKMSERPSWHAMLDWIKEHHPKVLAGIHYGSAERDFGGFVGRANGNGGAWELADQNAGQLDRLSTLTHGQLTKVLRRGDCGWAFGYDTFDADIKVTPPNGMALEWRSLTDEDYVSILEDLADKCKAKTSIETLRATLAKVAKEDGNAFDSAQTWLTGLTWDGTERVHNFLTAYCGAADSAYSRAVSRYLWSAMAGRVIEPGVKADMVPVLCGVQGCRKSTTIEAMVPDSRFYGTINLSDRDADTLRVMRGRLAIELAELRGLSGRDAESTKAFISAKEDRWIPKYMERETCVQRRAVFIGTTNKDDFLTDATGSRRFLPVAVGQCDPGAVARNRDQLWAEAAVMFKRGGVDYAEAERLARGEHETYEWIDPWEAPIHDMLNQEQDPFSDADAASPYAFNQIGAYDVLQRLGVHSGRHDAHLAARIRKIMEKFGWAKKKVRGKHVYLRPGSAVGDSHTLH